MPVYTFRCLKCNQTVQVVHGFDEPHPEYHDQAVVLPAPMVQGDVQEAFADKEVEYSPGQDAFRISCGGVLVRVFDQPTVIYRGSGFYTTDKVLYEPTDEQLDDYYGD
jgi:predicted nucleic acid-binding Zn ribbon protein